MCEITMDLHIYMKIQRILEPI